MQREIEIVRRLPSHRNIVQAIGACVRPENVFVCYEYMSGGTLMELLLDKERPVDRAAVVKDVATGMHFLHSKGRMSGVDANENV